MGVGFEYLMRSAPTRLRATKGGSSAVTSAKSEMMGTRSSPAAALPPRVTGMASYCSNSIPLSGWEAKRSEASRRRGGRPEQPSKSTPSRPLRTHSQKKLASAPSFLSICSCCRAWAFALRTLFLEEGEREGGGGGWTEGRREEGEGEVERGEEEEEE